jgi:hypothetical protein
MLGCTREVLFQKSPKVHLDDVIIVDDVEHTKLDDGIANGIGIDIKILGKQINDPFCIFAPEGNHHINSTRQARLGVIVQRDRTADHVGNISTLQLFDYQFQYVKLLAHRPSTCASAASALGIQKVTSMAW